MYFCILLNAVSVVRCTSIICTTKKERKTIPIIVVRSSLFQRCENVKKTMHHRINEIWQLSLRCTGYKKKNLGNRFCGLDIPPQHTHTHMIFFFFFGSL